MARHLPASYSVLLRSKKREPEDEIDDERLPEPADLISSEDVFPEDGVARSTMRLMTGTTTGGPESGFGSSLPCPAP